MNPGQRPIFRPDAVRRYMQNKAEPVLPRFQDQSSLLLWVLALFFIACGCALCLWTKIPVYASGHAATVGATPGAPEAAGGKRLLIVLVPTEYRTHLRAGQRVVLRIATSSQVFSGSLVAVEPTVSDPALVCRRYGPGACAVAKGAAALALVEAEVPAEARAEVIFRADVEVGARRIGARLPVVGSLLGE